ncbi:MAG: hypothetical protein A2V64_04675 [Bacteroidetes bacterium RBG_13_43_22]|nr:MAG: hypothetical protein A2V64_04675 [Bacteroidetes bacterium RBG_13_43_22]OFY74405.1 MAG: hypothetical protein A2V46_15760 [Bacteroidetes bacterium RBG_19FT_COMBO_42_7]
MDAKLTLSIDKDVARRAKIYARSKGRSLSDLVENYLKLLTKNTSVEDSEYTPRVKSLLGCISLPEDFDYKKEKAEYLAKKYL